MPGTLQTLPVPPPVSVPTLLNAIRLAAASGGSGGAAWGDITGTLSNQADLQAALDAKLSLAGGTMTGALVNSTNGAASTPALKFTGTPFSGGTSETTKPLFLLEPSGTTSNNWSANGTMLGANAASGSTGDLINLQLGAADRFKINSAGVFAFSKSGADGTLGTLTSIYGTITIRTDGASGFFTNRPLGVVDGYDLLVYSDGGQLKMGISNDVCVARDAADVWARRRGTNAQTDRLYGTYTNASNYRRLAFGSTTAGVFSIAPEGAGTGASGNVLHISGLPTSNPGPGILWNNAGTVEVGT